MNASGLLKEFFVSLGLSVDEQSFAKGTLAAKALEVGIRKLVDAAIALVEAVPKTIDEVAKLGRQINLASQRAGMSTDDFQQVAAAGQYVGLTVNETANRMGFLARNMLRAQQGSKTAEFAFQSLGVQFQDNAGHLRKTADVLADLGEAFSKTSPEDAEKLAESLTLFGRGGAQLVPLLRQGKGAIQEIFDEQKEYGAFLSKEALKDSDDYAAANRRVGMSVQGLKNAIAGPLIKEMTKLKDTIVNIVKANKALIVSFALAFFKAVIAVIKVLAAAFHVLGKVILEIVDLFRGALTGEMGKFVQYATIAATAFFAAWALAASPLLFIVTVLGALFLIVDDILTGMRGGKSVIFAAFHMIQAEIKKFFEPKEDDWWLIKALKIAIQLIFGVKAAWQALLEGLGIVDDEDAEMKRAQMLKRIANDINKLPIDSDQRAALWNQYSRIKGASAQEILEMSGPTKNGRLLTPGEHGFNTIPGTAAGSAAATANTINITINGSNGDPADVAARVQKAAEEALRAAQKAARR